MPSRKLSSHCTAHGRPKYRSENGKNDCKLVKDRTLCKSHSSRLAASRIGYEVQPDGVTSEGNDKHRKMMLLPYHQRARHRLTDAVDVDSGAARKHDEAARGCQEAGNHLSTRTSPRKRRFVGVGVNPLDRNLSQ